MRARRLASSSASTRTRSVIAPNVGGKPEGALPDELLSADGGDAARPSSQSTSRTGARISRLSGSDAGPPSASCDQGRQGDRARDRSSATPAPSSPTASPSLRSLPLDCRPTASPTSGRGSPPSTRRRCR
jgi:hypothetical protein